MTRELFPRTPDNELCAVLPKVEYAMPVSDWNGLIIVGEAPGKEEVNLGQPFVGRSGVLLNTALKQAGVDRRACLIANTFRYRPPANRIDFFFSSRAEALKEKTPLAEELGPLGGRLCRRAFSDEVYHLIKTINERPTKAVVALGRTACWALTGHDRLLECAGHDYPCRFEMTVPVFPTYHPSFILRGNAHLSIKWIDHLAAARPLATKGEKP